MKFRVIHLELAEANELVASWHRHHKPVQGHRFSIGAFDMKQERLCGAAIIGRPVARHINQATTLEVTRLVTDGTKNTCSFLYGACARIGRVLGYERIQTYVLDSETGVSLKAAGWVYDGLVHGQQWKHTNGKPRRTDQPICNKGRWIKLLRPSCLDNQGGQAGLFAGKEGGS